GSSAQAGPGRRSASGRRASTPKRSGRTRERPGACEARRAALQGPTRIAPLKEDDAMNRSEPIRDITTLQSHILERKFENPEDGNTLSWLLSALSISAKIITAEVRRARLIDVLGD